MKRVAAGVGGFLLLAGVAAPAAASDPFRLTVTVSGTDTRTLGFSSATDAVDELNTQELSHDFPGYNGTEKLDVDFFFRGLGASMNFASNSGDLLFAVPDADIDETFVGSGATTTEQRKDALHQLREFLKKDKHALKRLLTELARRSPVDPLAGNPSSLMSVRMRSDFQNGFTHKVSQVWACGTSAFNDEDRGGFVLAAADGPVTDVFADAMTRADQMRGQNEIGMGLAAQEVRAHAGGEDLRSTYLEAPLSYTWNFDGHPGNKLKLELPLSYTDVGGGKAYSAGLGAAYTYPVSDAWSLTPAASVGATGSEDLVAAGGVGAVSLTSAYTWRIGSFGLSLGDSLGRYQSLKIKIGGVEAQADVKNTAISNGLMLTGPGALIAHNLVMEYSATDTRLYGDTVYSQRYDEYGVALGYIGTRYGVIDHYYKLGLNYVTGEHGLRAGRLTLSARF